MGHRVLDYPPATDKKADSKKQIASAGQTLGEKVFFMRARIMAGQANLTENAFGLKDFKWLAREELKGSVESTYWESIKNMLPSR